MMAKSSASVSEEDTCRKFESWRDHGKSLRILILGQIGSGKSALVNGILTLSGHVPVAFESDSPTTVTHEGSKYQHDIDGVTVTIFDSPGLLQPGEDDTRIFEEMAALTEENVDLVIFCKKMTSRIDQGDLKVMRGLTETFGESIWENTLIVLTYANEIKLPRRPGSRRGQAQATSTESLEDHFTKIFRESAKMFSDLLKSKANVSPDIAEKVSVVPAGYDNPAIPGCDDWFAQFWNEACRKTRTTAQSAFFKISERRFSQTHAEQSSTDAQTIDSEDTSPTMLRISIDYIRSLPQVVVDNFREWCSQLGELRDSHLQEFSNFGI